MAPADGETILTYWQAKDRAQALASGDDTPRVAFGGTLSDDQTWAVLAFIKSRWPNEIRDRQATITERAGD